jgi:predicted phage baseplate assembly protein
MSTGVAQIDRRQLLAASQSLNGIDFIDVSPSQTQLSVHFLNAVAVRGSLAAPGVTITGGEVITSVPVVPVDERTAWSADSLGRPVLSITVPAPGDFSTYRLTVASPKLDAFFDHAEFRFHAEGAPAQDCAPGVMSSPLPASPQVRIDYLAKDFTSFRQALSEFSSQSYPAWVERAEADVGVVLLELLAAMADELSYYQDRVASEATLATATQRLSVTRHARLVDYEPAPATVATTVVALEVNPPGTGSSWTIDTPLRFRALGADGSIVEFEVEDPRDGLGQAAGGVAAWASVDTRWNRENLAPYVWDDSVRWLPAGSSAFYVAATGLALYAGQELLLDSPAANGADPPSRELVIVAAAQETVDALRGIKLTQIVLEAPTTLVHDLSSTTVAGNIVPAVQGLRHSEQFTLPEAGAAPSGPVVVRRPAGSAPAPDYRYSLSAAPLAWLATGAQEEFSPVTARPEILMSELPPATDPTADSRPWAFQRWLLDAGPADLAFTLTPEQYSPVLSTGGSTWYDYDGDGGTTIRFGDGTFGAVPAPGSSFTVTYRVGGGSVGNVPADTIVNVAPGQSQGQIVKACTNPFAATGGAEAETVAQVRVRAPQRFRSGLLPAVLAADYEAAARSLPWVQQAGTTFRWTGSWLTAETSVDPATSEEPTILQLQELTQLLDRQRLAGYESYVRAPRYVSIDLRIVVVGAASAFASDVQSAVVARLGPGSLPDGTDGFFDHSHWSFGTPLESSALLSAIQACPGVESVSELQYRQRGVVRNWVPLRETLSVAVDQILRVDNDPNRPDAGSLQVTVVGSK